MDFKEILTSWITSFNANESQKKLAKERSSICETCPSKQEIIKNEKWTWICGECGCPISKKVFSPKVNACPLGKWSTIVDKVNKTTI